MRDTIAAIIIVIFIASTAACSKSSDQDTNDVISEVRVLEYDAQALAELVQQAYFSTLSPLFQNSFSGGGTVPEPVTGPQQWKGTHETLRTLLSSQEADARSALGALIDSETGYQVRDAYIRAMIELYVRGSDRPVKIADLRARGDKLLRSPDSLPQQMEGYDLVLSPLTPRPEE